MVKVALENDTGIQLEIPSALTVNAEGQNGSPSALNTHEEERYKSLLKYLTKRSNNGNGSISTYKASKSTGSENRYFRYTYREQNKQRSKSIPGGNIRSPLAQRRAKEIKELIIAGKSIPQIVYTIGGFK